MSRDWQRKEKDMSTPKPFSRSRGSGLLKGHSMSQDQPRLDQGFGHADTHSAVPGTIQMKLTVNQPGDKYEQEADQMSERVMRIPNPEVSQSEELRKKPMEEEDAKGTIQAKESEQVPDITPELQTRIDAIRDSGQPLPESTRAFMEPRFGHDFSQVRIHTDAKAAESAQALNALAYTIGRDIVFEEGSYALETSGKGLLAHELTHVIQQGFAPLRSQGPTARPVSNHKLSVVQRQKKVKKSDLPDTSDIFDEIKKRNPDLAELITPASLLGKGKPPLVKGGPAQNGEEHIWSVEINPVPIGSNQTSSKRETTSKAGKTKVVTHHIEIDWNTTFSTDPEFLKQTSTKKAANTLTLAEPLFHELMHARIIMERDPHWTQQHSTIFQGYEDIMQVANSSSAAQEKKDVLIQIGVMFGLTTEKLDKAKIQAAQDHYYEFLVHEKFDSQSEFSKFGKNVTNARIANAYSKVIGLRIAQGGVNVMDQFWRQQVSKLESLVVKLYDKIDQSKNKTMPGTQPTEKKTDAGVK